MKIFNNINKAGKCLICNTDKDGKVTLIPIYGTEDGRNIQARQVHIDCLDLVYYPEYNTIIQGLSCKGD